MAGPAASVPGLDYRRKIGTMRARALVTVAVILLVATVATVAFAQGGAGMPGPRGPRAGRVPPGVAVPAWPWYSRLQNMLPMYGHRNWICIVDSAYPLQSRPGIETFYTGGHQLEVVRAVLAEMGRYKHLRPIVYCDKELRFVPEQDAPGVGAYRTALRKVLTGRGLKELPHEDIIKLLDEAAKTFNVLILKTDLRIPYTSVFINLDCGYWSAESEKRMRDSMRGR
jgi:hypothetical protein